MKPFNAHSDGEVLVPDEPVDLKPGAKYRVSVKPLEEERGEDAGEEAEALRDFLLQWAGTMKGDYPRDLARNHDHYLHGGPKR